MKTSKFTEQFPSLQLSVSQKYHQFTKMKRFVKNTKKSETPKEWIEVNYKGYPRFKKYKLPEPLHDIPVSLTHVLKERRSIKDFSSKPISLSDLSTFLHYSVGLNNIKNKKDIAARFYPSPGARYPIEVYPIVFNVERIPRGIYHYHLRSHSLEYLWTYSKLKKKVMQNFDQSWIEQASFLIILTAIFWRNEVKYGDRGYRHVMMETGIMTQNLYLVAQALGLRCCGVGGFIDNGINNLLDVDGLEESTTSVLVFGK